MGKYFFGAVMRKVADAREGSGQHLARIGSLFVWLQNIASTTGNPVRVAVQQALTSIRHRAATTMENPSQIRSTVVQGVSTAVLGQLQNKSAMRKVIKRVRLQQQDAPPNPDNRSALVIPLNYSRYESEPGIYEQFLLADSGEGDEERILIFGRESFQDWSHLIAELYVDGTFLICPALFYQFFVVLARRNDYVLPIFYCQIRLRTLTGFIPLFTKTFEMIRLVWPMLNPDSISVDFEVAIHNAIRTVFPESHIRGCFFHLFQNLKKHLSAENLNQYNNSPEFSIHCKMIVSLAFIPQHDLIEALTILENYLPMELEPILSYFTNTYIGRIRNNMTRAPPIFVPSSWNVYTRTINNEDKTNNFCEAFHRKVQLQLGVSHPTIWKFLDELMKVVKMCDAQYEQFVAGHHAPRKRRKYEEADERILNIVNRYEIGTVVKFRHMSQNPIQTKYMSFDRARRAELNVT
uniref:MULE domain-containing protein n=1 Tax=Meloidogyne hapla TaxID=6305 RepID=A0A1I8AZ57_MELHA